MKVLGNFLLLEPVEQDKETTTGIILPDSEEKPEIGEIIELGTDTPADLNKGDSVVYKKWSSHEFKYKGKDYVFVEGKDVLAVL